MSVDPAVRPEPTVRASLRDILTVGTLLGAVLLLVLPWGIVWATAAWAFGVALLWSSASWDTREKTIGTLLWPGGLIGPALAVTSVGQVCTQVTSGSGNAELIASEPVCTGFALNPWVGAPLSLIVVAAPFAVAVFLLSRSRDT